MCSIPMTVYKNEFASQTGTFSATTIFTPTSTGLYRASVDGLDLVNGAASELAFTFGYTNDFGATSSTITLGSQINVAVFRAVSGNNITLAGGNSYNGHAWTANVVLEAL